MSRVFLANYKRKGAASDTALTSAINFVCLCVYDLFSDAASSSEFVTLNVTVISESWIAKDLEESVHVLRYPGIYVEGLKNATKNLSRCPGPDSNTAPTIKLEALSVEPTQTCRWWNCIPLIMGFIILSPNWTLIWRTMVLWHVDPLLGNDREISSCTTTVSRQRTVNSHRGTVFSVRFVPRYCK
jgi:hypothetical protein